MDPKEAKELGKKFGEMARSLYLKGQGIVEMLVKQKEVIVEQKEVIPNIVAAFKEGFDEAFKKKEK